MEKIILNILFSILILLCGVRLIYLSYKNSITFSAAVNFRGYVAGGVFILLSIFSLTGHFNIFTTVTNIIRENLHCQNKELGIYIGLITLTIALFLMGRYYKITQFYSTVSKEEGNCDKVKFILDSLLTYLVIIISIIYLNGKFGLM